MTEKEAIEWLAEETSPILIHIAEMKKENPMEYINEAVKVACDALEEIQQYRAIGTIEEFKALKEKDVVKPTTLPFYGGRCTCGIAIGNKSVKYCYMCGAKFDWEGGE